jgi:hypothetical protein
MNALTGNRAFERSKEATIKKSLISLYNLTLFKNLLAHSAGSSCKRATREGKYDICIFTNSMKTLLT